MWLRKKKRWVVPALYIALHISTALYLLLHIAPPHDRSFEVRLLPCTLVPPRLMIT